MWLRFLDTLRCPVCGGRLHLDAFEQSECEVSPDIERLARQREIFDARFAQRVDAGALLCDPCAIMYPIFDGLPVLLCYTTPLHDHFVDRYGSAVAGLKGYRFPSKEPAAGERMVHSSFSKEWLDYEYDGVIWEMSYPDHEARFLQEMGPALKEPAARAFLEVGCGLGITTYLAHKNSGMDAVGIDLSLAVWKASRHYRENPFLHFVEASVFAMPFPPQSFDLVYSRGVLHHTFSTSRAFDAAASLCRPGGSAYLWVYGTGSIDETLFRRAAYTLERAVRPLLSGRSNSLPSRAFLAVMGVAYVAFNAFRRLGNASIQPLTFSRGVHAARDRFTPKYAHRHDASEVVGWFSKSGFGRIEVLDWRAMPPADHDDFRRNVGVRGKLGLGASAT